MHDMRADIHKHADRDYREQELQNKTSSDRILRQLNDPEPLHLRSGMYQRPMDSKVALRCVDQVGTNFNGFAGECLAHSLIMFCDVQCFISLIVKENPAAAPKLTIMVDTASRSTHGHGLLPSSNMTCLARVRYFVDRLDYPKSCVSYDRILQIRDIGRHNMRTDADIRCHSVNALP
ncbi:hypothetical protein BDW22DRAFT_863021 [Trametopsis cervina]|nr:hypothetical protein BDW22DRAFT_863021 [Trametopsis cervina]